MSIPDWWHNFELRIVKIEKAVALIFQHILLTLVITTQASGFRKLTSLYWGHSFQRCAFKRIEKNPEGKTCLSCPFSPQWIWIQGFHLLISQLRSPLVLWCPVRLLCFGFSGKPAKWASEQVWNDEMESSATVLHSLFFPKVFSV
jgi:hypothetical protein